MPYSYERITGGWSGTQRDPKPEYHFRIRDDADNRVATCFDERNAALVVMALNFSSGEPTDWVCGHNATAMCATCYQDLAIKAHTLAEENLELRSNGHADIH